MFRIGRTVRVTAVERDYLGEERRRAWRDLRDAGMITVTLDGNTIESQRFSTRVIERAKDGAIRAYVLLEDKATGKRYRRNLRCPVSLHSTSDRGIHLREA